MMESRLKEIGFHHKSENGAFYNIYRCECGKEKVIAKSKANSRHTKSCGCLRMDIQRITGAHRLTHGESKPYTVEYTAWFSMKRRCINRKHKGWKYYGGRGISVCKRWRDSYENFLLDMGRKPTPKHSLDRINNDGNYGPKNCRWATPEQQSRNRTFGRRAVGGRK